jgi:hypothetical protein
VDVDSYIPNAKPIPKTPEAKKAKERTFIMVLSKLHTSFNQTIEALLSGITKSAEDNFFNY